MSFILSFAHLPNKFLYVLDPELKELNLRITNEHSMKQNPLKRWARWVPWCEKGRRHLNGDGCDHQELQWTAFTWPSKFMLKSSPLNSSRNRGLWQVEPSRMGLVPSYRGWRETLSPSAMWRKGERPHLWDITGQDRVEQSSLVHHSWEALSCRCSYPEVMDWTLPNCNPN